MAISDVDTEGLAATEERLKAIGAPVKADRLDVTEREAFELYADAVKEHFGKVNQIYNNAGIAFAGDIEVSQFKDIEKVMDVDFWGVVNGTKVFLPHLDRIRRRPRHQHLQRLRAVLGARAGRLQRGEVRGSRVHRGIAAGDDVSRPSGQGDNRAPRRHQDRHRAQHDDRRRAWTRTKLAKTFDKKLASTSPEKAARIILDGVRKNRARVLVGPDAKALDLIVRITGSGYQRLFSTVMSRMVPEAH